LSDGGHEKVEHLMAEAGLIEEGESLYDASHIILMHHLNAALRAHHLYKRDVEYIVRSGQIIIVDEFTGRMMVGRRWSDGLHQAIEAKEGVPVQQENGTLASITFQNYFRLYKKLAGMTGTASTEADEFAEIYNLVVVESPTHRPRALMRMMKSIPPRTKRCALWCVRSNPPTRNCSRCSWARHRLKNPSSLAMCLSGRDIRRSISPSPTH